MESATYKCKHFAWDLEPVPFTWDLEPVPCRGPRVTVNVGDVTCSKCLARIEQIMCQWFFLREHFGDEFCPPKADR